MEKELENLSEITSEEKIEDTPTTEIIGEVEAQVATETVEKVAENPKSVAEDDKPALTIKSNRRVLQGKVFSNKANKTIVVTIERQIAHPLYKKYYKRSKKIMAHDENNDCNIGDIVKVKESRPLSARKRWELVEIVQRAK